MHKKNELVMLGVGGLALWLAYRHLAGGVTTLLKDWGKDPYGEEARWEIPYLKHPNDAREFYGFKSGFMFNNYDPAKVGQLFGPPAGEIKCNMLKYATAISHKQHGGMGTLLCPKSYRFVYGGVTKDKIVGDPRALYSLDALMRVSGVTTLEHMGMYNPNTASDFGHQSGCGIDVINESDFVKLIAAAVRVRMPVCAILKGQTKPWAKKVWAWWDKSLPGPIPKFIGNSNIPHKDHFHLILPRPNLVQGYFNKKPAAVPVAASVNPDHLGIPGSNA